MASAAAAKKWPRPSQCWRRASPDQPQVRLVDQGRRLQRLPGLFMGQALGGELAQLVVHQRQQLFGRGGVACSMADRIRVTSLIGLSIFAAVPTCKETAAPATCALTCARPDRVASRPPQRHALHRLSITHNLGTPS